MKAFENYSTHIRSTRRELLFEYFLPLLAEFLILVLCIVPFRLLKALGPLIEEPALVGEEQTKPTVGRLAFGVAALAQWFVFTFVASRAAKKDRHYASSFFGFAAGILLWQFIGEISWHYSVGGVHFVPFESVTTFPVACMFILLLMVDQHTWYIGASLAAGSCGLIYSIVFLLFRVKTRRGRLLASMLTYISIGVIAFGLMEG